MVRQARATPPRSKSAPRTGSRGFTWAALAIVVATCIAYAPALNARFLFDDEIIGDNPTTQQLWPPWTALHPPPQTPVGGRPVINYTLALNYALNERLGIDQRPDPDGPYKTISYRVANLLLHLACGALLLGVLRRTFRRQRYSEQWARWADPASLVITALWLIHPIQSEAVNYVIERTEIIVSLCYLGTLYASIRAWDAESTAARLRWYGTALVASLIGMGSKEVMISAPLAVILYDRAFRWKSWGDVIRGGRALFYMLLVATTAWLLVLMALGPRTDAVGFHVGIPWYQWFYSQMWAVGRYLRLVFWPDHLTMDYGAKPIHGLMGVPGAIVLSAFGIATLLAWTRVERWGWFGFLGAWFFTLLAPSSSFVPMKTEIAAERRIYLALAAVFVLLVIGVVTASRRALHATSDGGGSSGWAGLGRHWRWAASAIIAIFGIATFERSRLYTDGVAMWRDVIAKTPENPRGYENLAAVLAERTPSDLSEAEGVLHEGLAVDSAYPPIWDKLAAIDISQHRLPEARQLLYRALRIDSTYERSLRRLGNLYLQIGQPDSAVRYLQRATVSEPRAQVYAELTTAYMAVRRPEDAIRALRSAIALDGGRTDLLQYLGALLTETGHAADAARYLERAVDQDPSSGVSVGLLGVAYAQSGRPAQAIVAARLAATKANGDSKVYVFAGRAMLLADDPSDAEQSLARAVQLAPSDSEAAALLAAARVAERIPRKRGP